MSLDDVLATMTAPLSVILQVTKRCDFDCLFTSGAQKESTVSLLPTIVTSTRTSTPAPLV